MSYNLLPNYFVIIFYSNSTVDCQLGLWTPCDSDCGFAGKMRLFGKMPNRTGVRCSQGDTWQKCVNLPPCPGDHIIIYKTLVITMHLSSMPFIGCFGCFEFVVAVSILNILMTEH